MQVNVQEKGTILGCCVVLISPEVILAFVYASLISCVHAVSDLVPLWNFSLVPSTGTCPLRLMP